MARLNDEFLTSEEEYELGLQILKGDIDARNELVMKYKPLVWKMSKKYKLPTNISREDLVQYGLIRLIKAASKFNVVKYPNIGFIIVAKWWVRESICRALWTANIHTRKCFSVKRAMNKVKNGLKIDNKSKRMIEDWERYPSEEVSFDSLEDSEFSFYAYDHTFENLSNQEEIQKALKILYNLTAIEIESVVSITMNGESPSIFCKRNKLSRPKERTIRKEAIAWLRQALCEY